jgi:hypothetical protein
MGLFIVFICHAKIAIFRYTTNYSGFFCHIYLSKGLFRLISTIIRNSSSTPLHAALLFLRPP